MILNKAEKIKLIIYAKFSKTNFKVLNYWWIQDSLCLFYWAQQFMHTNRIFKIIVEKNLNTIPMEPTMAILCYYHDFEYSRKLKLTMQKLCEVS